MNNDTSLKVVFWNATYMNPLWAKWQFLSKMNYDSTWKSGVRCSRNWNTSIVFLNGAHIDDYRISNLTNVQKNRYGRIMPMFHFSSFRFARIYTHFIQIFCRNNKTLKHLTNFRQWFRDKATYQWNHHTRFSVILLVINMP